MNYKKNISKELYCLSLSVKLKRNKSRGTIVHSRNDNINAITSLAS